MLYNDDDTHKELDLASTVYKYCTCRPSVRTAILHQLLVISAQEIVTMKIVNKLKEAVQDDKVLDDHTADYKPHQRGWEDTSKKHPEPNHEGVRDERVSPHAAATMAYPQTPVPSFHLASSLCKHAAKEDGRVPQDED